MNKFYDLSKYKSPFHRYKEYDRLEFQAQYFLEPPKLNIAQQRALEEFPRLNPSYVDAVFELTSILAQEINLEIDREVLADLHIDGAFLDKEKEIEEEVDWVKDGF